MERDVLYPSNARDGDEEEADRALVITRVNDGSVGFSAKNRASNSGAMMGGASAAQSWRDSIFVFL